MLLTAERVVQSPPSEVFAFVATNHFANHPRWDPALVEMTATDSAPIVVGSTARIVRRVGSRRSDGTATVTAYEPERFAAFEVRIDPFELDQQVQVIPERGGETTRLRLTMDVRAKGMLKLLFPLMRGQFRKTMRQSLATIAELIEEDQRSDAVSGTGEGEAKSP